MVGGALVWTVPAVQTLAGPAFANGSPAGTTCLIKLCLETVSGTPCVPVCFTGAGTACCNAINAANALTDAAARAAALLTAFVVTCGGGTPTTCPA